MLCTVVTSLIVFHSNFTLVGYIKRCGNSYITCVLATETSQNFLIPLSLSLSLSRASLWETFSYISNHIPASFRDYKIVYLKLVNLSRYAFRMTEENLNMFHCVKSPALDNSLIQQTFWKLKLTECNKWREFRHETISNPKDWYELVWILQGTIDGNCLHIRTEFPLHESYTKPYNNTISFYLVTIRIKV